MREKARSRSSTPLLRSLRMGATAATPGWACRNMRTSRMRVRSTDLWMPLTGSSPEVQKIIFMLAESRM
jgi:hypothetical protein